MSKFLQRSDKSIIMSFIMKKSEISFFYLLLTVLLFVFFGCSTYGYKKIITQKNAEEIAVLKKTVSEQQEVLQNLQALTANLIHRNSELEQSIPPRDLLESLQNGFVELRKKITILEKKLPTLQKSMKKLSEKKKDQNLSRVEFPREQKILILGLLSLQAGNPDQAVDHLQEILIQKKSSQLKAEILLAVAYSFLAQGHAKQAASNYGTYLREYPKSPHIPQALYFLGKAMGKLGEQKKQIILWNELVKKYPKSSFVKRVK